MKKAENKLKIVAPVKGKVIPLNQVPDSVFAQKMMGEGFAVELTDGKVVAPFDGEVIMTFPTKHAYGLKRAGDGVEILMHIGMDTVELEGQGFETFVKQGDQVKAGDLLVRFDIEAIKAAGYSVITPIVITNTEHFADVLELNQEELIASEDFLAIVK